MVDSISNDFRCALEDAIELFNNQEWYEAHDALEDIWNNLDGDNRQIIQGILQVAVSQFHLKKGNHNGATILLGEGLGRIRNRVHVDFGLDLKSFCCRLELILHKLQNNIPLNNNDIPTLIFNVNN